MNCRCHKVPCSPAMRPAAHSAAAAPKVQIATLLVDHHHHGQIPQNQMTLCEQRKTSRAHHSHGAALVKSRRHQSHIREHQWKQYVANSRFRGLAKLSGCHVAPEPVQAWNQVKYHSVPVCTALLQKMLETRLWLNLPSKRNPHAVACQHGQI